MYCFSKAVRLRKRREFRLLSRGSKRLVGKYLVIDIRENCYKRNRLGLTVSRRYGNACNRNRFKRLVREAFRLTYPELPGTMDINIRPRRLAKMATMQQIQHEMMTLLQSV